MKIDQMVREMSPPRYTTTQAADVVGRSPDTLRRWREQGRVEPSEAKQFGQIKVWLYTPDDIRRLRDVARVTRTGPSKTTDE